MKTWNHTAPSSSEFALCRAPQSRCCVCNELIYGKGRRKTANQPKGSQIKESKIYPIYKQHRIVITKKQSMCNPCDALDIDKLVFKTRMEQTNVVFPAFLKTILQGHDKLTQHERTQKDAEANRKRRRPSDAPLHYQSLSEESIKIMSGLSLQHLQSVVQFVKQKGGRIRLDDLIVACTLWRHHIGYRMIAVMFGYAGESGVQKCVDRVIKQLKRYFVPHHIGAGFWRRGGASVDDDDDEKEEHGECVDDHIPEFVHRLHPDKNVVAIADATYLYTQKSLLNYQFQKCTYSVYKGRNLQKEHVVCTPDGFVLFSDGPFFADGYNNDQIIWDWTVNDTDHEIRQIFPEIDGDGDSQTYTIVADRGYRKCLDHETYKLLIPHGVTKQAVKSKDGKKKKKKKALTVEQGNQSKLRHLRCVFGTFATSKALLFAQWNYVQRLAR